MGEYHSICGWVCMVEYGRVSQYMWLGMYGRVWESITVYVAGYDGRVWESITVYVAEYVW